MFHVEKIMFHAADGFQRQIFDRVIVWDMVLYNPTENGGLEMKKLLVLIMALAM
ncbi:MAG: hypothetical protein K0R19_3541, partial [Bacillota bacterium]|nr:hypothetical protein [Bacillota bacterium]